MKILNINVSSKSKKAINYFCLFFNNYLFYSSNNIKKKIQKKLTKIKIVLLKSPHVNKNSQEQFEISFFKKHFTVGIKKSLRYLFFLKKLSNNMYSDVNLKIKQILTIKKQLKVLNSNFLQIEVKNNAVVKIINLKVKKKLNLLKKNLKFKYFLGKKTSLLINIFELSGGFLKIVFK